MLTTCLAVKKTERPARICKTINCNNEVVRYRQYCQKCKVNNGAVYNLGSGACRVSFGKCENCGEPYTARRTQRKYCKKCDKPTIRSRREKNLFEITRWCIAPGCGKEFRTYNRSQLTCPGNHRCQRAASQMRRKYIEKMRYLLGLCARCGDYTNDHALCDSCTEKRNQKTRKRRLLNVEFGTLDKITIGEVFEAYGGICQLCGERLSLEKKNNHDREATIDHIIPISKGGQEVYENVQLACRVCNAKKGNREWYRPINKNTLSGEMVWVKGGRRVQD